jgi:hypothetical protein
MPPLPTIADTYRVTLNWNPAHGITPRNVLHFRKASSDEADLRDSLNSSFGDLMWEAVQQDWAFTSVDILKLDGSSATQTLAVDAQGSLVSGDAIVEACCVISLRTAQRGSRGRGRVFLGPLPESKQSQGIWTAGTTIGAAWASFADAMFVDSWELVVASYVHADAHRVTSIHNDSVIGLQKRRRDQLVH